MEYFDKSKICREFLKQYSEALYPELLPNINESGNLFPL